MTFLLKPLKLCFWLSYLVSFKKYIFLLWQVAHALEDELERNDVLNSNVQEAEELRKIACSSDIDLLEYFRKKHKNNEKSDPNKNLSCFSWRSPVEEVASRDKGYEDEGQVLNGDDIHMNDAEKVYA